MRDKDEGIDFSAELRIPRSQTPRPDVMRGASLGTTNLYWYHRDTTQGAFGGDGSFQQKRPGGGGGGGK